MTRYIALILLLIIAGCGRNVEQSDNSNSDYSPIIVIQFRKTGVSSILPWGISTDRDNVSAAMLFPDDAPVNPESSRLVHEALENNMLMALVSDTCFSYWIGRDHIQIWIDSSGTARALPEELLDGISCSAWLDNTSHQDILLQLFDMHKPDFILMDFRIPDASSVLQIAEYWTAPDILSRYTVVLFSFPEDPGDRGWCAFAGERINGSTPYGLTEHGLFSTIRLLAGLKWVDDLPDNIPALSILEDTNDIWSHQ
ncbi:MAG: hypothetical protein KAT09_02925 [Candidatus Aegiribacteria sp.]|nr:hypothetical protein [Candidatus Aegiribacteria sp.]